MTWYLLILLEKIYFNTSDWENVQFYSQLRIVTGLWLDPMTRFLCVWLPEAGVFWKGAWKVVALKICLPLGEAVFGVTTEAERRRHLAGP